MTAALAGGVVGARAQTAAPAGPAAPDQPAAAEAAPPAPFGFEEVARLAADLARAGFAPPQERLQPPFADLSYDAFRGIRFRREADPWRDLGRFGLALLPPGLFFNVPVRINLVENGVPRNLPFDPSLFDFAPGSFPADAAKAAPGDMGWSGFRLRTVLNRPGVLDELAVFQGASYFRVIGRGNVYGLSLRGLAIGTGSAQGEEFPAFREFWITTPTAASESITVLGLLDSASVAGAYEFVLTPGSDTVVSTRLALFPRREMADVGIAPLTSMFWFGPGDRGNVDDYRPGVHDSDGLQMVTGGGEHLWRSLSNPAALQISAFSDRDPRGFGLMQRDRRFSSFEDAETRYEDRPSVWIAPEGGWGQGSVVLIEIPVDTEFNDNIVSFWQPGQPLAAGVRHDFAYRMGVGMAPAPRTPIAQVVQTRSGLAVNGRATRSFLIDYDLAPFVDQPDPVASVTASDGAIDHAYVVRLPEAGVMRLAFEFRPERAELAELTARLDSGNVRMSETWLYRWTRE